MRVKSVALIDVLNSTGYTPVLADIGSAGARHAIWDPIAAQSVVLGFDPDERNRDESFSRVFKNAIMVNKAVALKDDQESVEFVLTTYPGCSSLLEADLEALSSFIFRDLFVPVRKVSVPAISLNRVIEDYDLGRLDWLKLDTQGMDLKLIKSLRQEYFDKLLAVDIEPGLIHAYKGEDLFAETHTYLMDRGFWLSDLRVQAYAKVRPETVVKMTESLNGMDRSTLERRLKRSPTAAEARYLREIAWLRDNAADRRSFILSFVFALLDGQTGFAFDVLTEYEALFGADEQHELMRQVAVARLAKPATSAQAPVTLAPPAGLIVRLMRHLFHRS